MLHLADRTERRPLRGPRPQPDQLIHEPFLRTEPASVGGIDAQVPPMQALSQDAVVDAGQPEQNITITGRSGRHHRVRLARILDVQAQAHGETSGLAPKRLNAQLAAHAVGTPHECGAEASW
ncbi:MAG: hypothetical protein NVS3B18_06580 [Candidatus Dormibacteria bacterium]